MINNRKKSIVSDIKWSKQGNFICFSFLDGHAILGSVEAVINGVKILIIQYI